MQYLWSTSWTRKCENWNWKSFLWRIASFKSIQNISQVNFYYYSNRPTFWSLCITCLHSSFSLFGQKKKNCTIHKSFNFLTFLNSNNDYYIVHQPFHVTFHKQHFVFKWNTYYPFYLNTVRFWASHNFKDIEKININFSFSIHQKVVCAISLT